MGISNITLVKVAAIGGIATATMGLALKFRLNNQVSSTEYYKDALKTLRTHRGAVYILGEPIKDYMINVESPNNYTKTLEAKYEVPIKGSKEKGTLYFWAIREKVEDSWVVNRIELGLDKDPTKRLLVKKIDS